MIAEFLGIAALFLRQLIFILVYRIFAQPHFLVRRIIVA